LDAEPKKKETLAAGDSSISKKQGDLQPKLTLTSAMKKNREQTKKAIDNDKKLLAEDNSKNKVNWGENQ